MKTLIHFFVATLIFESGVNLLNVEDEKEKPSIEIEFKYKNAKIYPDGKIEKEDFESKNPEEIKKFLEKKPEVAELLSPSTIPKKLQFPEETKLPRPVPFFELLPKVTVANGAHRLRRRRPPLFFDKNITDFPSSLFPKFLPEEAFLPMPAPPSFHSLFRINLNKYPYKKNNIDGNGNSHLNQTPTEDGNSETNSTPTINETMMKQLINIVLETHNEYRKLHNAEPLTHNPEISKFSQEYAEKLSNMSDLIHSDQEKYGENLASGTFDDSYENIVKNAIKLWYSEKNSGVNGKGHFTQLVWKSSKELGIGFVVKNGTWVLVCNYSPPGNVLNQFNENVEY